MSVANSMLIVACRVVACGLANGVVQYTIFNTAIEYINGTLQSGQTSRSALYAMVYGLFPEISANINDAAASQVQQYVALAGDVVTRDQMLGFWSPTLPHFQ